MRTATMVCWGCGQYLTSTRNLKVLRERLGPDATIETLNFCDQKLINSVEVSFHPAGHILGSAQIRLESQGEVWVVSGDYKTTSDPTCDQFEPVKCHTFITESTFGLPVFHWKRNSTVYAEINQWWLMNQERGRATIIYAYALGKAQRVLAGLDASIGPILVHGAVHRFNAVYQAEGICLPHWELATLENAKAGRGRSLIIAPPSAANTSWLKKFGPISQAFASGWMRIRGVRRRRALDKGFVLSDHADWKELISAIRETGAERIGVTHGYIDPMVRYLKEDLGKAAFAVPTRYVGESTEEGVAAEDTDGEAKTGQESE